MQTLIALLRGINVGGRHKLPMQELRALLEELGLQHVKTYIQSGNVAFQSDTSDTQTLAGKITKAIDKSHGFAPHVLILSLKELQQAIEANPFPQGEDDPKTLHLYFLDARPSDPNIDTIESLKKESEEFELKDKVFYLHAPDGIGRSKLAAKVEKALGVPVTARNWRSVGKVMALAEEVAEQA